MNLLHPLLCALLASPSLGAQADGGPHQLPPLASSVAPDAEVAQPRPDVLTQFPNPGQGQSVVPGNPAMGPTTGCDPSQECVPAQAANSGPTPRSNWPEAWGAVGLRGFYAGSRMAPNGVPYSALFDQTLDLNIGLLPNKKLYLFGFSDFWAQAAGPGITNPHQGSFDFSKREWDFIVGAAWNYYGPLELRVYGYANNNLNRGVSLANPSGYNDGTGIENRYYLPTADPYDVGKLSFLSIGYIFNGQLIGADGNQFQPGLTARAYLTHDIPCIRSYVFFDGTAQAEALRARLLLYDLGLAARPFLSFQNLELRVGTTGVYDVELRYDRNLGYVGVRLQF